MWLRRGITANLRLHARPGDGLDTGFIRTSLGRPAGDVDAELRQMRDDGLVERYEAGAGRACWYLTPRGARR